jgi:hypothetical protein
MSKSKRRSSDPADWPVDPVSIKRLRLDPENPRFATSVKRPTQQELIKELLDHEDVIDLLGNIARHGFFPSEPMVAVKDGQNLIVVEGNRRLAALKLLDNPELAPVEYQARIRQLVDRHHRQVERVPVVTAPSRTAVVPLLIARHKGEVTKPWTTVMQARYIQSRLEDRNSIDDVAEETGLEKFEIVRALRDAIVYDVVRSLELPAEVENIVADPRRFAYTNLQRLIESTVIQNALGMKLNDLKGFETSLPSEQFERRLGRIVTDVALGEITSRTHNTASDLEGYVRELEKSFGKGKPKKGKPTSAGEFVDPSKITPKTPKPGKTARAKKAPIGLIPKSFRVDIEDDRIEAVVAELKSLKLTQFPNAAAITFRSLLDMAVTKYMNDTGELAKLVANISSKQNKGPHWLPTLGQQLNYILNTPTIPLGAEARRGLQKFMSDTSTSLTLEAMNWFTHIRYVPPTVDELRSFWTKLTPLLQLTLQK